jgi:AAA ATPase-like protein
MSSEVNPFIHGRAVAPGDLVGRDKEVRRLCGRLAAGQSTAIIGMPHVGKTSLIRCLEDAEYRTACVGDLLSQDVFSYLDAQTLHGAQHQGEFWARALAPVRERLGDEKDTLAPVAGLYHLAETNQFGTAVLQQFFAGLSKAGSRLILLLDEFDDFLTHPVLNSAEFYGGLRSLASLSPGLMVVFATRKELDQLNALTQAINPHGSPYFNVFTEIRLGALPKNALPKLLEKAGGRFGKQDQQFVSAVSGLHPYLAQSAAAMLWDAHEDGLVGAERYARAGRALYQQSSKHFADCWKFWSTEMKKAITLITLCQIPKLIPPHKFHFPELAESLYDYTPELEKLEAGGFLEVEQDGEWVIKQGAFTWWMADELRRGVRDEKEFGAWLQAQELDGFFTKKEREKLGGAVRTGLSKLGKGAVTMIEAFAKGFGETAAKQLGG